MGTRDSIKAPKVFKRSGAISDAEKNLVSQFVLDQPGELKPTQVTALAKTLNRSKDAVTKMIQEAREHFLEGANRYIEIHRCAVEDALAEGSPKGLEQARLGAEWAIEKMSSGGVRIIEAPEKAGAATGVQIMVGVRIGGLKDETNG